MFYLLFVFIYIYTGDQLNFHIRWCLYRLTVTWLKH